MTSTQDTKQNAVLALTQYAYTRLEPLFAQAKKAYPQLQWTIQITFADAQSIYADTTHLTVYTLGTPAEFYNPSYHLTDMDSVDAYAAQVANDVAAMSVAA